MASSQERFRRVLLFRRVMSFVLQTVKTNLRARHMWQQLTVVLSHFDVKCASRGRDSLPFRPPPYSVLSSYHRVQPMTSLETKALASRVALSGSPAAPRLGPTAPDPAFLAALPPAATPPAAGFLAAPSPAPTAPVPGFRRRPHRLRPLMCPATR